MTTILDLIKKISSELQTCCTDKFYAEQEAWWLLEKVTTKGKSVLLTSGKIILSEQQQKQLKEFLNQRIINKKPIAYILGSVPFYNLEIKVKPPILIPRPETEEWVNWLIEELKKNNVTKFSALDLCCGSGCIGLALGKAFPKAQILGIDINPQAIELSNENKELNKIKNIEFLQSDLYKNLHINFKCDLIVSNPPYLAKHELQDLSPEVKNWEDHNALLADNQGMDFYHKILKDARHFLNQTNNSCPCIVVEIGPAQKEIESVFKTYNFNNLKQYKDLQKKFRWCTCWL